MAQETATMVEPSKTLFQRSLETQLAYESLGRLDTDEVLTHEDLHRVIGRDPRGRGRGNVTSAINILLSEGVVIAKVRNVGWKRLGNNEIVEALDVFRKRQHSPAKRGIKTAAAVDVSALDGEHRAKFNASVTQLHIGATVSSTKAKQRIAVAVAKQKDRLPTRKALDLFS